MFFVFLPSPEPSPLKLYHILYPRRGMKYNIWYKFSHWGFIEKRVALAPLKRLNEKTNYTVVDAGNITYNQFAKEENELSVE